MYCDKWENWADCCRDNTNRSCKADSLRSSHENSADNADDLNDACSLDDAESSDNAGRSDDSTARLMTASVVRLIAGWLDEIGW